jgi:hypothetical protein
MTEWIFILMMVLGVGLFAAGGTGPKWARRYVLPIALGLCLMWLGVSWWQSIISAVTMIIVFCLPYGDSVPKYWQKFLIGCTYSLPSLAVGLSLWVVIVPVGFITLFFLSNWKPTAKAFTWKLVEGAIGFLVSASLISAYLNRW